MSERAEECCENCGSKMLSFETKCYVCGKNFVKEEIPVRDRLWVGQIKSHANSHLLHGFMIVIGIGIVTLFLHWIRWMSFFPYLVALASMGYGTYRIFIGFQISSRMMKVLVLLGYSLILFFGYWVVFSGGESRLSDFGAADFKNSMAVRMEEWGKIGQGDCVESEFYFSVNCESESAAFKIVDYVEVRNAPHYPYESDWQNYSKECPDETDTYSYPSLSQWRIGNHQLKCLEMINLENIDE